MAAITWRDVVAPQGSGVAGLTQTANQSISSGLNRLGSAIDQRRTGIIDKENEAEALALSGAINDIGSLQGVDAIREAIKGDLVGKLGLSDKNAVKAREALSKQLLSAVGQSNAFDSYDRSQLTKAEEPLINDFYTALNEGNLGSAASIAKKLSSGGKMLGEVSTKRKSIEQEQEIKENKDNLRMVNDLIINSFTERLNDMNGNKDPLDTEPLSHYVFNNIPKLAGIADLGQINNILSATSRIDNEDPINRAIAKKQAQEAYEAEVANNIQIAELEEKLRKLPTITPSNATGGDIVKKELVDKGLADSWGWFAAQSPSDIAKEVNRAILEVGDTNAVSMSLGEDPEVIEGIAEGGGVGSHRDQINYDDLVRRAMYHKGKGAKVEEEALDIKKKLARLKTKKANK